MTEVTFEVKAFNALQEAYHQTWTNNHKDTECPYCDGDNYCGEDGTYCENNELFTEKKFYEYVDMYLSESIEYGLITDDIREYLSETMNWRDFLDWKEAYELRN